VVVGLSGKYCAGKDSVARVFATLGFAVIDVDSIGHEILAAEAARVIGAFGPSVRGPDGGVDRKALGRIVFGRPAALSRLESIVHPPMVARVKELLARHQGDVVVNAAVLHRMGLHALCHVVVCVEAPPLVRLLRALRRDRRSLRESLARITSQRGICPQLNEPAVDTYTVRNRGSARSLERRITRLAQRLRG
jgi:dephospho-CoA kinase